MLVNFSIENFRSFRDRVDFTAIAAPRKKRHADHVKKIKYGLRILPVASFFGANASGKSNLVKAIALAKLLVTNGIKRDMSIPVAPFRLNRTNPKKPTSFSFDLYIESEIYNYRFSVDTEKVFAESLSIVKEKTEITLFSRNSRNEIELIQYKRNLQAEEYNFLKFVAKGTRPNQLFLTESIERNVPHFNKIYEWFRDTLVILDPSSKAVNLPLVLSDVSSRSFINSMLTNLDTGIAGLVEKPLPPDEANIPDGLLDIIEGKPPGTVLNLRNEIDDRSYTIRIEDGDIRFAELQARHDTEEPTHHVDFRISEESDGTRRLIDMLPAFCRLILKQAPVTFVIDELDRSMHSHLTRKLIEDFLSSRGENRGYQLLFTTHDTTLLDQELLRQDEIWILEKSEFGSSELYSLSDYKDVRYDLDIAKRYHQGRFGGVPYIAENLVQYGRDTGEQ